MILTFYDQKEAGIPKKIVKVEDIPGLSKFLFPLFEIYIYFNILF